MVKTETKIFKKLFLLGIVIPIINLIAIVKTDNGIELNNDLNMDDDENFHMFI